MEALCRLRHYVVSFRAVAVQCITTCRLMVSYDLWISALGQDDVRKSSIPQQHAMISVINNLFWHAGRLVVTRSCKIEASAIQVPAVQLLQQFLRPRSEHQPRFQHMRFEHTRRLATKDQSETESIRSRLRHEGIKKSTRDSSIRDSSISRSFFYSRIFGLQVSGFRVWSVRCWDLGIWGFRVWDIARLGEPSREFRGFRFQFFRV